LSYVNPYILGYGSYASPNSNGIEVWGRPAVTFPSGCIDFAIRYRVSGAKFWENNFGRNYRLCVVQGDYHVYRTDQPLAAGDVLHGVTQAVPNVTRIVVEGETTTEWLKLRVDPRGPVLFSWERMLR
jgi:hypothetical protein